VTSRKVTTIFLTQLSANETRTTTYLCSHETSKE